MNTSSSIPVTTSSMPVRTSSMPVRTSNMPVTASSMPVISNMPVTTSSMPVTTSSMPVTTSSMPVTTSSMPNIKKTSYDQSNNDNYIEDNQGKRVGLGFGLFFNTILILVSLYLLIYLVFSNHLRYNFIKTNIILLFIFGIILIGSGLAEIFTYKNYKHLGASLLAGDIGMRSISEVVEKGQWDNALKVFSYINFTVGGISLLATIILLVYFINNKESLFKIQMDINNIYEKLKIQSIYYNRDNIVSKYIISVFPLAKQLEKISEFLNNLKSKKLTEIIEKMKYTNPTRLRGEFDFKYVYNFIDNIIES